jgi:small subunit ribosomal protein S4
MSKYRGPRLRVIRRIGELVAFTRKTPKYAGRPKKGRSGQRKLTQFARRLIEKQKLLFYYGVSEKQLVKYVKIARKSKEVSGLFLLQLLAMRLDNIIFSLSLAPTLPSARQLVNHGNVTVDHKRVTIPSFSCFFGQTLSFRNLAKIHKLAKDNFHECGRTLPSYLTLNLDSLSAIVNNVANRDDIPLNLDDRLVIEYYSNRLLCIISVSIFFEIQYLCFVFLILCLQLFFLLFLYRW